MGPRAESCAHLQTHFHAELSYIWRSKKPLFILWIDSKVNTPSADVLLGSLSAATGGGTSGIPRAASLITPEIGVVGTGRAARKSESGAALEPRAQPAAVTNVMVHVCSLLEEVQAAAATAAEGGV